MGKKAIIHTVKDYGFIEKIEPGSLIVTATQNQKKANVFCGAVDGFMWG